MECLPPAAPQEAENPQPLRWKVRASRACTTSTRVGVACCLLGIFLVASMDTIAQATTFSLLGSFRAGSGPLTVFQDLIVNKLGFTFQLLESLERFHAFLLPPEFSIDLAQHVEILRGRWHDRDRLR